MSTTHPPSVTTDDLRELASGRPPFVSIYIDTSAEGRDTLVQRVAAVANGLRALGTPPDMVRRTTTAFLSPPPDRAAMAVIAASDGRSVIASSPEPLARDIGDYGAVPRLGPLIEFSQQMITHAVVRRAASGAESLIVFGADGSSHDSVDISRDELVAELAHHDPAAVFLVGAGFADLRDRLDRQVTDGRLRADCRIEELPDGTDDDVAEAVVRHTADVVARRKVDLLRDLRLQRSLDVAVEGLDAVVAAVNSGRVATLLVNCDPDDPRRAVITESGSVVPVDGAKPQTGEPVRLVDALIWSVLRRGGAPVIIPSTGENGPDDDLGALLTPGHAQQLIDR